MNKKETQWEEGQDVVRADQYTSWSITRPSPSLVSKYLVATLL